MRTTLETDDARLVELSRKGNREAFGRIVERYQSLICALTYSASGNIETSEDLAQVTFITAWCQLKSLREPEKLKSWLCRIARNATTDSFRQQQRTPTAHAEELDAEITGPEATPRDKAISQEEQAILWRVLEELPANYREPLVLFYRQEQSVAEVADALDLSEDAVKQRLSRGRELLSERTAKFIESALHSSGPGKAFTADVLAALPLAAAATGTAGIGAAAKGTAATKSGGLLALLGTWLTPMICVVGSIMAQWFIVRAAPTSRERRVKKIAFIALWTFVLAWAWAGQLALRALARRWDWSDHTFFGAMAGFWWFYATVVAAVMVILFRRMLAIRQESEIQVGTPQASGIQLTSGTRLVVVAGIYLSAFLWLIDLAGRARDFLSAGIMTASMVVLAASHFFQVRRRTGVAAARAAIAHVTLVWAVILVILNWRLDVWLAVRCGTGLAEIHRLLPVWVIPALTLALVVWIGIVWVVTRPKRLA